MRLPGLPLGRRLPGLPTDGAGPLRPMSFVVVRFSPECEHNIQSSPCVQRSMNQLVLLDNTANAFFTNVAQALNEGLASCHNDLVVAVHEDVYLPPGWQRRFESVLAELEATDPAWGVVGSVGIAANGTTVGHAANPFGYRNTFRRGSVFSEVLGLDDQLLAWRRRENWRFDPGLPGIHGLAMDLLLNARREGRRSYVVDAPLVHKHRSAEGKRIRRPAASEKIRARDSFAYRAERRVCEDFLRHKWASQAPFRSPSSDYPAWVSPEIELADLLPQVADVIDRPILLLAKGGGGSRLLSLMAADCGLYRGSAINADGDSEDMVPAVYETLIEKYAGGDGGTPRPDRLRLAAARMLSRAPAAARRLWGFKVPESLLVLPELAAAFPAARYVHLRRHPLATTLRRPHMTARTDNAIGRLCLRQAYRAAGSPVDRLLHDAPALRMAYTTRHQLQLTIAFLDTLEAGRLLDLSFEDVVRAPDVELERLAAFLDTTLARREIARTVDPSRAGPRAGRYPEALVAEVARVLQPVIESLGYPPPA